MSATVTATASDRSDFRTVMVGGTQIGVLTAVAVVAFLIVSRQAPAGVVLPGPAEPRLAAAGVPLEAFPPPPLPRRRSIGVASGTPRDVLCGRGCYADL